MDYKFCKIMNNEIYLLRQMVGNLVYHGFLIMICYFQTCDLWNAPHQLHIQIQLQWMCNQHKSLGYVRFINDMSTWHQLHPSNKPWLFINQDEWISKSLTTWKLLSNSPSDPHFQLQPIEMLLGVQHGQGVLRLVLKRGL